jgi:hypothetical protein
MKKILKTMTLAFFSALILGQLPNILYYLDVSPRLPVEIAYIFSILYLILLSLSVLSLIFTIPLFISASTNKNKKHLLIALFLTIFAITSLVIAYIDIVKVTRNS